jgi:DNA-binding NarL/FixJ family response regulator
MNQAEGAAISRLRPPAPMGSCPSGDRRVVTVVICDDQPAIRDAIRLTFAASPQFSIVADAWDAESCLNRVRETQPDLLILDVNIPCGGPHIATAAKQLHPRLHIVVFSGRADGAMEHAMLAAGADQYVLKTGRVRPLIQAMESAYHQLSG